jgi:hypothetical protein
MKKNLIAFSTIFIIFISFLSCKKVADAIFQGLDTNVPDVQVTIPTIIAVSTTELPLGSDSYNFNLDSIVKAKTAGVFGANAVRFIKIKQISINITNADQLNNLANFESARMTIQSNSNSNPIDVFSQAFPDMYATSFTFAPTNSAELFTYLKGSTITYNIFGKNRRITTKPLNMVVSTILAVK